MAVRLLNFWISCSLILNSYKHFGAECRLTLTPSVTTSISLCPGDQLLLTCNTSSDYQRWSIHDPNMVSYTRLIVLPTTADPFITPLEVLSFTFNFDVISAANSFPLVTTLTVDGVTDHLNTTRITCLETNTVNSKTISVHILEPNSALDSVYDIVDYNLMGPRFGLKNATVDVIVRFNVSSQENDYSGLLVPYVNVTSPSQVKVQAQGIQLTIPYNVQINMSIIVSLCGRYHVLAVFPLLYTNCGHLSSIMTDAIRVIGDIVIPVMEGSNVSFSCHSEFILSGPNSSTCMRNGEWEPDPREVECRQKVNCGPLSTPQHGYVHPFASTLEGEEVVFSCISPSTEQESIITINVTTVCFGNGTWLPSPRDICTENLTMSPGVEKSMGIGDVLLGVITSSVTFLLTAILCFIIGFTTGHYSTNLTKCALLSRGHPVNSNYDMEMNPVYDTIMPQRLRPREEDPELRENVAYNM